MTHTDTMTSRSSSTRPATGQILTGSLFNEPMRVETVYTDAVGIDGGAAARSRAARIRELAVRLRELAVTAATGRWNALVGDVSAEINASNSLHQRATAARHAADRAFVDAVDRVMATLYTAATRVARQSSMMGGGDARGGGGTDSADAVAPAGTGSTRRWVRRSTPPGTAWKRCASSS